jgi:hypothetical protein
MHQHIKQLWVDALRSGKYQQGTGHLRREGNYCPLGVLCDLYDRDENGPGWDEGDETYLGYNSFLPPDVRGWAAMTRSPLSDWIIASIEPVCATAQPLPVEFKLSQMNDGGASFDEIANFIEQQL